MADLKPCPFCGGKAFIMSYHSIKDAYCICKSCKVRMPNSPTRQKAIEAWNRRAEDGTDNS